MNGSLPDGCGERGCVEYGRKGLNFAAQNTEHNQTGELMCFISAPPSEIGKSTGKSSTCCVYAEEQLFFTGEQRDAD